MAVVRLSDAIIPEVYLGYTAVNSPETTAFVQSGIAVSNAILNQLANGTSRLAEVPFWKDLDANSEPNYSNDDPDDKSTPEKVGSSFFITRRAFLNKSYAAMDLVAELAGSSPMQHIRNRFGTYWQRAWQRRVLAVCKGLLLANKAQNAGDMVVDVAIEDGNAATSANLFTATNFINACYTLGDKVDVIGAIAVHSIIAKRMVENDEIEMVKDSQGALTIPVYKGRRVIVDDSMPVVAGGVSGFKYTSILFGAGSLGFGAGTPDTPVWTKRDEEAGNGGGMETIGERQTWLIHPFGYKWTETTVSEESPTLANLALAANWQRVFDRKLVPLAFLVTNG